MMNVKKNISGLNQLFNEYHERHLDEYKEMPLHEMNQTYATFETNVDKLLDFKPGEKLLTVEKDEKRLITFKEWEAMEDWGFERVNNFSCTFEGTQADAFMLHWILHELHLEKHIELEYEDGVICLRSLQLKSEEV